MNKYFNYLKNINKYFNYSKKKLKLIEDLKDDCDIVYGQSCKHEWFEGKCIHCGVTPDQARAVMENVRLNVIYF
jgi:hypothetical protein